MQFGRLERRRLALLLDPARPESQLPLAYLARNSSFVFGALWGHLVFAGAKVTLLYFFLGEVELGAFFGV